MIIAARELSKHFADLEAVHQLSFEVAAGEIFGLIGPNGAGKTTTLRMLAGLLRPDAGRAAICGHDVVTAQAQAKAAVGFLTGSTGLYERLTAAELLTFFGRLYGLTPARAQQRIALLAGQLQLEQLLPRRCGGMSTGERQRVSLARAALHDPPALILDEPTAGLDVLASRFVAEFLRQARAAGRALLFSTHYLTEAELLCDRVGFIHRGRLLRLGTPAALKAELGVPTLEEAFLRLVDLEAAA